MGVSRVKDGVFIVRWLDGGKPPRGVHRQVTLKKATRKDAERLFKQKTAEVAARPQGDTVSRQRFAELAGEYLRVKGPTFSASWRRFVARTLDDRFIPLLGSRRVEDLRAVDLLRYQAAREREVTGATLNKETRALIAVLNWAEAMDYIARNPISSRKVKSKREAKRERALTVEEWQRLVGAFDDPAAWERHLKRTRVYGDPRPHPVTGTMRRYGGTLRPGSEAAESMREKLSKSMEVFEALLLTGCRKSEVTGLRWKDVDRKRGLVTIALPKTAKRGRASKTLPLVSGLKALIDAQPKGIGNALVFRTPDGLAWGEKRLRHLFHLALDLTHDDEDTPNDERPTETRLVIHSIRHSVETWLLRADYGEGKRNLMLGHADRTTADRYSHLVPEDLVPLIEHLTALGLRGEKGFGGCARGYAEANDGSA